MDREQIVSITAVNVKKTRIIIEEAARYKLITFYNDISCINSQQILVSYVFFSKYLGKKLFQL